MKCQTEPENPNSVEAEFAVAAASVFRRPGRPESCRLSRPTASSYCLLHHRFT